MGGPDLFVVCKNCQAEVSPYITECPYCGNRLRKRAPKIERDDAGDQRPPKVPRGARPARDSLSEPTPIGSARGAGRGRGRKTGTARPRRTPRVRRERSSYETGKPVVSIAIVLVSVLFTIAGKIGLYEPLDVVVGPSDDQIVRVFLAPFFYARTGYELVALGVIFLFGWLLERRHGWWAPLLVFAATAFGGMAAQAFVEPDVFAAGAGAGALGLLGAWVVRDLLARRAGEETESDLLGVLVIAVVLILVPIGAEEARPFAHAAGGIIGFVFGLGLARLPER